VAVFVRQTLEAVLLGPRVLCGLEAAMAGQEPRVADACDRMPFGRS